MRHTKFEHIMKDSLLIALVAGVIVATQYIYDFLIHTFNIVDRSNSISMLVAVLITFLVYRTYEKRIISILNKTFFKGHHLRRIEIAHLNDEIIGVLDIDALATLLVDRLTSIFGVQHIAVFVKDVSMAGYRIVDFRGLDIAREHFSVGDDEAVINSLHRRRKHIFYKRSYHFLSWNEAVHVDNFFERYSAKVVVPLFHKDDLVAFITLEHNPEMSGFYSEIADCYYSLSKYAGQAFHNALTCQLCGDAGLHSEEASTLLQRLKLEAIDKLATGVAHEIRNPLTIISMRAQRLMSKAEKHALCDEEVKKSMEIIERQIDRAKEITSRLIKFSKSDDHLQDIHLGTLISELIEIVSFQVSLENIHMMKFIDPHLPPLKGRIADMRELFMNILLNAVDEVKTGGRVCVYIHYDVGQHAIVAHIMDSGDRQISDDELEAMGTPFFTSKEANKQPGLGLYICQQIVARYNGSLHFSKNDPSGVEVVVSLPCISSQGIAEDTSTIVVSRTEEETSLLPLDVVKGLIFEKQEVTYGTDAHS